MAKPYPPGATILLVKNGASVRVKPEAVERMKREEGWIEPAAPKKAEEPTTTSEPAAKLRSVPNSKRAAQ